MTSLKIISQKNEEKGAEFGLKVSEKKTKYMTTSLSDGRLTRDIFVRGE